MNLREHIAKLVEHSKHLSHIEWFPYSGGVYRQIIRDLNTALAATESEEERWRLFLSLLPLWTTERDTEEAQRIFGKETLWKYNEPLVLATVFQDSGEGRPHISIHCGQFSVCRIVGTKELLDRYHQEITASGHTITLAKLNRR